jgi:hypothetical protein
VTNQWATLIKPGYVCPSYDNPGQITATSDHPRAALGNTQLHLTILHIAATTNSFHVWLSWDNSGKSLATSLYPKATSGKILTMSDHPAETRTLAMSGYPMVTPAKLRHVYYLMAIWLNPYHIRPENMNYDQKPTLNFLSS